MILQVVAVLDSGRPFAAFFDQPDCLLPETAGFRTDDRLDIADNTFFVDNKLNDDGIWTAGSGSVARISKVSFEIPFPGQSAAGKCGFDFGFRKSYIVLSLGLGRGAGAEDAKKEGKA